MAFKQFYPEALGNFSMLSKIQKLATSSLQKELKFFT